MNEQFRGPPPFSPPVVNKPRGLAAITSIQPVIAQGLGLDRSKARSPEASQIRAARALLDWDEIETAKAVGITTVALGKIERGATLPSKKAMAAFQEVFSAAGVVLLKLGKGPDDGYGVRMRKTEG